MAIVSAHLSILSLVSYQNQLNYRLSILTNQRQNIATSQAAIIQQYSAKASSTSISQSNALTSILKDYASKASTGQLSESQIDTIVSNYESLVSSTDVSSFSEDPNYILLQLKDNDLDIQQGQMETQLKAVTANLESQQKLEDSNIKNDFGYSLSL